MRDLLYRYSDAPRSEIVGAQQHAAGAGELAKLATAAESALCNG